MTVSVPEGLLTVVYGYILHKTESFDTLSCHRASLMCVIGLRLHLNGVFSTQMLMFGVNYTLMLGLHEQA